MDASVILMMLTPKITSVAWCYRDGAMEKEKLSEDQFNRRIVEFPSLFKYLSYIYFYPTALVGPAFEYNDYVDFIELKGDFENIPSAWLPSLFDLVGAFFQIALLIVVSPHFEPRDQWKPHFTEKPLLRRFFDVTMAAYMIKAKYYAGWLFSNANVKMCGLSYNGVDAKTNKPKWDRVYSMKVWEYELADNPRTQFECWNRSIQVWLKRYVFFRIASESELKANPKKASFAANASFMISAFWHGFYPYYYVTFLLFFMIQQFSKTLYNCGDYFKIIPRPIQYFVRWLMMNMLVNTTLVAFFLLQFDKVGEYAKSIVYFPYIAITSLYILGKFMVPPKKKVAKKE
jgi:lysophospholipid acyltransferase